MTIRKLTSRAWWYPADPDPARVRGGVGYLDTPHGGVLVDAGHSPGHARDIRAALTAAGLPAPTRLVYTHHHWDHVWGGCVWPEAEVIAHRAAKPLLEAERRRPWSHDYLTEQVAAEPLLEPSFTARAAAVDSFADFTIRPPTIVFDETLRLPDGIEVRHVGGGHAPDSTIVIDHETRVAFLGDCFYPPPYHLRRPTDSHDVGMIRALLADDLEWYVDSHSEPRRRGTVTP